MTKLLDFQNVVLKIIDLINFIRDKIKFELPNITIVENNRHSYSIHKKLHGKEWHIGLIDKASTKQKNAFIKSVATFMADLHQVNVKQAIKKCPSLKEKQWPLRTLDDMLIGFKKYFFDEEIKELHTEYTRIIYRKRSAPLTLLHGDFGSGNCRLNTTAALKCVFDFGNAVLGEPELDLIWLYQPKNPNISVRIIKEYEKLTGIKLDIKRINELRFANSINSLIRLSAETRKRKVKPKTITSAVQRIKKSWDLF